MRIVNNKIYIKRGETPTYTASVIDKDTGAPLIIDQGVFAEKPDGTTVSTLILEFVVRKSAYSRDDDVALKYNLILGRDISYHVFDGEEIKSYNDLGGDVEEWHDDVPPKVGEENYLHRRIDGLNEKHYAYYSNGTWVPYEFTFNVTFSYDDTSVLEPKIYQYEITLLGGALKSDTKKWDTIVRPTYKKPLLDMTDFIVEGSISE